MEEEQLHVSKYDIKIILNKLYDRVGDGEFSRARKDWIKLKNTIIRYYGIKGQGHETFKELFSDGDYLLTRITIDENKERMYTIFSKISFMVKRGGKKEYTEKDSVLSKTKGIYEDILEAYRSIITTLPNSQRGRETCVSLANAIGDELMELREQEIEYRQLEDYNLYALYNTVRKKIGNCEGVLPRILDTWRSSSVKRNFENQFSSLFEALEDLLAPVKEKNLKDFEDKIMKMLDEGATIEDIAKEIGVNPNTVAIYIKDHMKIEEVKS